jgi:hypothetical protein
MITVDVEERFLISKNAGSHILINDIKLNYLNSEG